VKAWLTKRVWLLFWVVCLGQVGLWFWWIPFAIENRPQMIVPGMQQKPYSPDENEIPQDEEQVNHQINEDIE